MSETPSAFPLAWPAGKARTPASQRRRGSFKHEFRPISRAQAIRRLKEELERLGGRLPIISSNLPLTRDGRPYLKCDERDEPGVCLYFQMGGHPYAMACDTFDELPQNIAAIAAHIEATRAITRYGVATAAETLRAFEALPSPGHVRPWWDVLGVSRNPTADEVNSAYRQLVTERHPDMGGTHEAMAELNAARDEARRVTK